MYAQPEVREYFEAIREQVCSRCVERLPGGPPCEPLGKICPVEQFFRLYLDAIQEVESPFMGPYVENIERCVCSQCDNRGHDGCPCPLNYLLPLTVQAIETVDQSHEMWREQLAEPVAVGECGH